MAAFIFKSDLAERYFPSAAQRLRLRKFTATIDATPGLRKRLKELGYRDSQKILTPPSSRPSSTSGASRKVSPVPRLLAGPPASPAC